MEGEANLFGSRLFLFGYCEVLLAGFLSVATGFLPKADEGGME